MFMMHIVQYVFVLLYGATFWWCIYVLYKAPKVILNFWRNKLELQHFGKNIFIVSAIWGIVTALYLACSAGYGLWICLFYLFKHD